MSMRGGARGRMSMRGGARGRMSSRSSSRRTSSRGRGSWVIRYIMVNGVRTRKRVWV